MEVRGAAELRVKESDRISALAAGFRAMGAEVDEFPDGFRIESRPLDGRRRRRGRRPPAGHGLRHRRDAAPPRRRRSPARPRSTSRIPASSRSSSGSPRPVTVDKIYLVGFMAAGKTTVARALAARLGWRAEDVDELIEARERRPIADIFAQAGRAVLPRRRARDPQARCCRSAMPSSRPAAARSWIPRIARRSTWTACRSGSTCRSICWSRGSRPTAAGRWPPTARRWSGCSRCAQAAYAQAHVRIDAGAAPAEEIAEQIVERLETRCERSCAT